MKSVKNGSDVAIFSGKSTRAPAEVFESIYLANQQGGPV